VPTTQPLSLRFLLSAAALLAADALLRLPDSVALAPEDQTELHNENLAVAHSQAGAKGQTTVRTWARSEIPDRARNEARAMGQSETAPKTLPPQSASSVGEDSMAFSAAVAGRLRLLEGAARQVLNVPALARQEQRPAKNYRAVLARVAKQLDRAAGFLRSWAHVHAQEAEARRIATSLADKDGAVEVSELRQELGRAIDDSQDVKLETARRIRELSDHVEFLRSALKQLPERAAAMP